MDSKIFLRKYRVSAEEIEAVGELGDSPVVYEGEEIDSGKKMRLEVFPAAALKLPVRAKLEAEAIAAKKLNHANIPALHDFGVEDDHLVYVTEGFDGTSVEEWVTTCGPMPVSPVLRIASQVVSALGTAAFHRIVHRAINPSNLVLVPGQTAQGEWPLVKVLHFVGVAPTFSGTNVSAAVLDKSLPYVSPEQLQHGTVDFRSEMYSLAGTMWFLLTGAPPLMTANGPMAPQSATTALAVKKMSAMPKEIRRLLAQMLSTNPDARPRDPLAFHRGLQDCQAPVERPEVMSRKLALPALRTHAIGIPKDFRTLLKALACAALFLTMTALAALALRGLSGQRGIVRAHKPISVPIRVTRALPSATPVSAKRTDTMVWIATSPGPALARMNTAQSVPAKDNADARPPATNFVEYASTKQVAVVPVLTISEPPANLRAREKAPVTASNVSLPPPAINSSELAATTQVELARAPAKPRDGETRAVVPQSAPKKIITPEVRRAEPAESEARRVEPARPKEKSAAVAPDSTAPLSQPTGSAAQTEQSGDAKRDAAETKSRKVKRTEPEPTILLKVPR